MVSRADHSPDPSYSAIRSAAKVKAVGAAKDAIHLAAKAWGSPALKNMNLHTTQPVSRSDAGASPAA